MLFKASTTCAVAFQATISAILTFFTALLIYAIALIAQNDDTLHVVASVVLSMIAGAFAWQTIRSWREVLFFSDYVRV